MKKEIVITKDGSNSIYLPQMDEHYHSINGSIAESEHIFIQTGLAEVYKSLDSISILEIGMGTGLNVLTSYEFQRKNDLTINYWGVEAFPLDWDLLQDLNYSNFLVSEESSQIFKKIHDLPWNASAQLADRFTLNKIEAKIHEIELPIYFDLVYFDAFAPVKQEDMWTGEIFKKIYDSMNNGGVLVTYCVKGVVRRRLQSIGFEIEKLPGPIGGKREILRARKR